MPELCGSQNGSRSAVSRSDVARVVGLIESLSDFAVGPEPLPRKHMGGVIADAALQAGLRWETVVAPRVQRVCSLWPTAHTVSTFLGKAHRWGLADVLAWNHPDKLHRAMSLAGMLAANSIETHRDLWQWLQDSTSAIELCSIPGIGPKTVDYLGVLVAAPTIAIDRHVRVFLSWAGVEAPSYHAAHVILMAACKELDFHPAAFDAAVWKLVVGSR